MKRSKPSRRLYGGGEPRDPAVFDPIRFKGLTAGKDGDWDDVHALKITEVDSLLEEK